VVLDVQLEGILAAGDTGDASLGPGRVRVRASLLGNDGDRAVPGDGPGKTQAGEAAADDHEIKLAHKCSRFPQYIVDEPRVPKIDGAGDDELPRSRNRRCQSICVEHFEVIDPCQRGGLDFPPYQLLQGRRLAGGGVARELERAPDDGAWARASAVR